jgi:hypothetical protein
MSTVVTRAKFQCVAETRFNHGDEGTKVVRFQAVYDPDVPEDQRYARYTPSGTLEITVDNPNVRFELGQAYYLDFTKMEPPAEDAS